jgi:hypothetical protein
MIFSPWPFGGLPIPAFSKSSSPSEDAVWNLTDQIRIGVEYFAHMFKRLL